ncbi:winged helix-turn-helix transcriptional regulator [Streptomyces humi]|uniref:winged helix-turn-helix transcriptional regulator n=1 Tax=Streptomyces humi TaxID=1428620 RepID=UPI001F0AC18A|nr:helix-turn-helix domain-containing protein [Streptomyces humi]
MLIVRKLLTGPERFTELRAALPGISPRALSSRLRRFVLTGLVARTACPEIPPRVEYQLTPGRRTTSGRLRRHGRLGRPRPSPHRLLRRRGRVTRSAPALFGLP